MKNKFAFSMLLQLCVLPVLSAYASSPSGFDDYYEVRAADINGDGLEDLYVYSTPKVIILAGNIATPIVANAPAAVADFALLQQADGSFRIDSDLSPSERGLAQSAPRLSIDLKFADYNADGRVDLFTGKLSLFNGFSNARPAFVFAPAAAGAPTHVTTVNESFINFFVQASGMIADANYIAGTQIRNNWYTVR